MNDHLKYLIQKLRNDLRYLHGIVITKLESRYESRIKLEQEIDDTLNKIEENTENLYEAVKDADWDNKTNGKFQKLNAILLIIPTIFGLIMLFFGIHFISLNKEISGKLKKQLISKDSLIKAENEVIANFEKISNTPNQYTVPHLMDSIKTLKKELKKLSSISEKLPMTYYMYEFSGQMDTVINLKKLNIDLLIFKNKYDRQLNPPFIVKPSKLNIREILYAPANTVNGYEKQIWSDQFVIISVRKLKYFNDDIVIQISEKNITGDHLLTLKVK